MKCLKWPSWLVILAYLGSNCVFGDEKYNAVHPDGSFEFGYDTPDSYHFANADRNNVVNGQFGGRNPGTGAIDKTIYTAGPRGYRPRGKNIARKYDLSQVGPRPVGSRDDPYYDPYEDPSYNFAFKTRTYSRDEAANRVGDVRGSYSYLDDVGERHNVEFIAGKRTGFHVKTPFPDSNPNAYGPLYFNGRGKPIPRGRTAIQRGLDGSYRFISAGPDQRRTETSDSTGHVRGSYTYLDDKGVQHSVHYIAGPETGYRVLKNVKGPHFPTVYPFARPEIVPPDYYDSFDKADKELFDGAASGRPIGGNKGGAQNNKGDDKFGSGFDAGSDDDNKFNNNQKPSIPSRPGGVYGGSNRPSYGSGGKPSAGTGRPKPPSIDEYDDGNEEIDPFGGDGNKDTSSQRPPVQVSTSRPGTNFGRPTGNEGSDDGSYKPLENGSDGSVTAEGAYRPSAGGDGSSFTAPEDNGSYRPTGGDGSQGPIGNEGTYRPTADGNGSFQPSGSDGSYKPSGAGGLNRPTTGTSRPSVSTARPSIDNAGYTPSIDNGGADGSTYTPGIGSTVPSGDFGGAGEVGPSSESYPEKFPGGSANFPSSGSRPVGGKRPSGSGKRPSGGTRPGSGLRPDGAGDISSQEGDDGFNLFGSESSGPVGGGKRPNQGYIPSRRPAGKPSDEGQFGASNEQTDEGFGNEPSGPESSTGASVRPSKRPGYANRRKPSSGGRLGYGDRIKPSGARPLGGGSTDEDGFNQQTKPSGYGDQEKPSILGVSGGSAAGDAFDDRGTIVTNLGDRIFSVPPGVSVRAHVQAIDLLPLGSRIPSPSEQYQVETTVHTEQLSEASQTTITVNNGTTTESSTTTKTTSFDEDIFK